LEKGKDMSEGGTKRAKSKTIMQKTRNLGQSHGEKKAKKE